MGKNCLTYYRDPIFSALAEATVKHFNAYLCSQNYSLKPYRSILLLKLIDTFILCLPVSVLWGCTINQSKDTSNVFSVVGLFFHCWRCVLRWCQIPKGTTMPYCLTLYTLPHHTLVLAQSWAMGPCPSHAGGVPVRSCLWPLCLWLLS